jgi:hypothetical protein
MVAVRKLGVEEERRTGGLEAMTRRGNRRLECDQEDAAVLPASACQDKHKFKTCPCYIVLCKV